MPIPVQDTQYQDFARPKSTVLTDTCYRMDIIREHKGIISELVPTKIEPGEIDETGCTIYNCNSGELQKSCDQSCAYSCPRRTNGSFDLKTCTWTCGKEKF